MLQSLFWASFALLTFTYVGFPLLLVVRARLAPRRLSGTIPGEFAPPLAVVFAAFNEEAAIAAKLENLYALDYPSDRMRIVVASDGSTDATVPQARALADERVEVLDLPRIGKNRALNAAIERARGDVIVFTDADAIFALDALRRLVTPFADPEVGCVAGDFRYTPVEGDPGRGAGERAYWALDRSWKRMQSQAGSVTSASGQIYALRRSLVSPLPDGVMDDVVLSTGAVAGGMRIVFAEDAVASGPPAPDEGIEFRRKVRNAVLGLRAVLHRRALLDPFRYGFYAIQLLTHKVLRRCLPIPLVGLLVTSALLEGPIYRAVLALQLGLHGLAVSGLILQYSPVGQSKLLRLPFFLDLVASAMAAAFVEIALSRRPARWTPAR